MKVWHLIAFAAGVLLGYVLFGKTEYIPGDPVPYEVIVEVPTPYAVDKPIYINSEVIVTKYDTIRLTEIDTIYIINDYFTAKHYHDTLLNDNEAFISLAETIYRNEIVARQLYFQNKRAVTSPVFIAGGLSVSNRSIATGFLFGQKKGVYHLQVGLISPFNQSAGPMFGAGYYRKF